MLWLGSGSLGFDLVMGLAEKRLSHMPFEDGK
jgi:hypothetical protein